MPSTTVAAGKANTEDADDTDEHGYFIGEKLDGPRPDLNHSPT